MSLVEMLEMSVFNLSFPIHWNVDKNISTAMSSRAGLSQSHIMIPL